MAERPLRSNEIPVLETPRLRLRGHALPDFAAACELWAHPEVVRHTVKKPQTPEEVWSRILRYSGLWSICGYGYWLVQEKATGAFVGEVGFSDYRRAIDPPLDNIPEIGWILHPTHHGKGFATEAAQAAMAWAAQLPLQANRISCIIHEENPGSFRVADKLGFTRSHISLYRGEPFAVLFAPLSPGAS